jgi:hypothetical protein
MFITTDTEIKILGFYGGDYEEWRNIPEDAILQT